MPRTVETEFFVGQGIVLISELDSNYNPVGFKEMGDVSDLSFDTSVEKLEYTENQSGQGNTAYSKIKKSTTNATMTTPSATKDNMERLLNGSRTDIAAGTGATSTGTAKLGYVLPVGKIKVSNLVVKGTGAKSATTYVLDKNYTANLDNGSIYVMTAAEQTAAGAVASVADGDVLGFTFDHAAQTTIEAAGSLGKTVAVRFEGLNTAKNNEPVLVEIPRFQADPTKSFKAIGQELNIFEAAGLCAAPYPLKPYKVTML